RYSAAAWVLATVVAYIWIGGPNGLSRRRAVLLYLAGFLALVAPRTALSLSRGPVPGALLFPGVSRLYAHPHPSPNVQDRVVPGGEAPPSRAAGPDARRTSALHNLWSHAVSDLREMIGWPVAIACVLGALLAFRDRRWKTLAPVWLAGLALYLALVP